MDKREVEDALGAVLPIERGRLTRAIKQHWNDWDPDGDGVITVEEFVRPENGLRSFIIDNLNFLKLEENEQVHHSEIPNLDTHPRQWFEYWDQDISGTFEKDELIRAMIKSFCVSSWGEPMLQQALDMRKVAFFVWQDQGYHEFDSLGFEEFMKPHGLADTIMHNWVQTSFFGEDDVQEVEG